MSDARPLTRARSRAVPCIHRKSTLAVATHALVSAGLTLLCWACLVLSTRLTDAIPDPSRDLPQAIVVGTGLLPLVALLEVLSFAASLGVLVNVGLGLRRFVGLPVWVMVELRHGAIVLLASAAATAWLAVKLWPGWQAMVAIAVLVARSGAGT